jgi:Cof subfamily protein (haloacid dehalogenase superfamily)
MIKFIAADMDGTLLTDDKTFDPNLFDIIRKLKQKGILFAVSSGRQYAGLVNIFEQIKNDMLFICQNGGHIVYKNETLYSNLMDKALSNEVIKKARTIEGCEILACTANGAYIENNSSKFINELGQYLVTLKPVNDLTCEEPFIKVSLCDYYNSSTNCGPIMINTFKGMASLSVSGDKWFDVTNKNVNKGAGIKFIQNKFSISYDETMVFGDNYNDVEMLQSAFHSYAMENAHDDIKKCANFIAGSNNNNGVVKEIIKLL